MLVMLAFSPNKRIMGKRGKKIGSPNWNFPGIFPLRSLEPIGLVGKNLFYMQHFFPMRENGKKGSNKRRVEKTRQGRLDIPE